MREFLLGLGFGVLVAVLVIALTVWRFALRSLREYRETMRAHVQGVAAHMAAMQRLSSPPAVEPKPTDGEPTN